MLSDWHRGVLCLLPPFHVLGFCAGLLYPLADAAGFSKPQLTAGLVVPVVLVVALLIRRLRLGERRKDRDGSDDADGGGD